MKQFIIHEDKLYNLFQISEIWMKTDNSGDSEKHQFNIMGRVPSTRAGGGISNNTPAVTKEVCLASFATKEEQESVFNRLKSALGVMLTEEQPDIEQLSIESSSIIP